MIVVGTVKHESINEREEDSTVDDWETLTITSGESSMTIMLGVPVSIRIGDRTIKLQIKGIGSDQIIVQSGTELFYWKVPAK